MTSNEPAWTGWPAKPRLLSERTRSAREALDQWAEAIMSDSNDAEYEAALLLAEELRVLVQYVEEDDGQA